MRLSVLLLGTCAAVLAGCTDPHARKEPNTVDAWLVTHVNDTAIQNAILRQQTLFPYHFVTGGAAMNELGRHDLEILAAHYRQNPGSLSIRQGQASKPLYDARVASVVEFLRDAGLPAGRVTVTNTPAGGEGMPSATVLTIAQPGARPPSPPLQPIGPSMSTGERP
jgi:hypothetical protein